MWGPAPAVNPNLTRSSSGGSNKVSSASSYKVSSASSASNAASYKVSSASNAASYAASEDAKKNKKKRKMQKLDSSILGFTVHAAPDRVNAGEIHYT